MAKASAALLAAVSVGVVACGGSHPRPARQRAPARPTSAWSARLHAPTHRPRAGKDWRIAISARTARGEALRGHVSYEFLLLGHVVARKRVGRPASPSFFGTFHDVIRWPRRAIGMPLTFRAVVKTELGVRNLDYAVRARR